MHHEGQVGYNLASNFHSVVHKLHLGRSRDRRKESFLKKKVIMKGSLVSG